jgi:hypothetical protein
VKNCGTVVFQQWENVKNCGTVVFQQWGKCEKLLNSGVSAMGENVKNC